jgi:hypothetical protein
MNPQAHGQINEMMDLIYTFTARVVPPPYWVFTTSATGMFVLYLLSDGILNCKQLN